MDQKKLPPAWRAFGFVYGFAVVVSVLALVARLSLAPWLGNNPLLVIFIIPILLSAYVGGLGPGLLSTALAALSADYYLIPPAYSFGFPSPVDFLNWLLLVAGGGLTSILNEALHRARRRADHSQRLNAVTLASIGDAVITTDDQGRVTFLNGEAEHLTGWPRAEAVGRPLPSVFHIVNEATRAVVEDPVTKVFRAGAVVGLANHTVLIARDGREFIIDDSGAPIRQADGKIIGVVLVFRDNTEKKKAEDAVRESQALYHSLVDRLPAGIFRKDAEGRYVFVNPFFCELKGKPPAYFLGKTAAELGPEECALAASRVSHHAEIMRTGGRIEVEEEYLRADGQTLFFHAVKTPVFNAEEKITGSQGILFDITQRRQMEASLRRSEEQLSEVVKRTRCIVNSGEVEGPADWREHALDEDSYFKWNFPVQNVDAAQAMLPMELQAGETYHQAWRRHRHPADHLQMNRNSGKAFLEGAPFYRNEFRCTDKHGQEHWMQQHVSVRKISENRWQIFGITTDVTELKANQERYRDQHALLRTLIDLAPDFIFVKDPEGRYLVANEALARCYGRPVASILNLTDADFLPAELATRFRTGELRALAADALCTFEDTITFPDGQRRVVTTNMVAFRDLHGRLAGLVGIGRDITAQKEAEEKIAREQARFKLIFDSVPIGIAFHTVQPDGRFARTINAAHLRICGLTRTQHDEPGIYDRITHPDDRPLQQQLNEQVKAGAIKQFALEKRYLHADGKVVWVNFSYQREVYPDGTTEELTTVTDITERKAAERQQMQLAVIVESSKDAIISKTLAGIITSWNHGAEIIFGYAASETIGQPMLLLFPAELQAEETEILTRIGRGENVEQFETERIRKDGTRIRISATVSPLKDSRGKIVGASTIARDITHQHILEEQLRQSQKMDAIGQLAGGVAHDFNNILAVIQMQTELAKLEGNFLPEQTSCLDEIQVAASRAANLTRQLLLFSRRQRLQPRELDLSDSITGMTKMLRRILGEDIQMQFKYAPQPLFIHADAGMMDQVLMNLTVNSRDAMPKGGQLLIETAAVEVDALAAAQSAPARVGSFVRLSVSDTGCGIPPNILPRIFEPFFTTKDVGKGTGLGLATVFSIVQQHQGWISVRSESGQGTTFDIYLPRLATPAVSQAAEPGALAAASGGTETILLVEDDAALRASVYKALAQLGYHVLAAANGAEALRVWQAHRAEIQLVLTDMVMPGGMSGKDLGERLLRENPQLKVIYASGYSAEAAGNDFPLEEGVNFLAKPFPAQKLAQTIRACLDKT